MFILGGHCISYKLFCVADLLRWGRAGAKPLILLFLQYFIAVYSVYGYICTGCAGVAESVDAPDLKSVGLFACGGSSPPTRTIDRRPRTWETIWIVGVFFHQVGLCNGAPGCDGCAVCRFVACGMEQPVKGR